MSTLKVNNVTDLGDDAVITDGALVGAGKILQVVQNITTTDTIINSATYADTTLSATITPTSATSKILIITNQLGWASEITNNFTPIYFDLVRDTTPIHEIRTAIESSDNTERDVWPAPANMVYLDSPSASSAVTYKTRGRTEGELLRLQDVGTASSIVLMEVAA